MRAKGFTLVEILIVIAILGILMSGTIFMGYNYTKTLQVKQEKERLVGRIEYALGFSRTSNYYLGNKYTYLDIFVSPDGLQGIFSAGTGFDEINLIKSQLSFSGAIPIIRLTPYERACSYLDDLTATGFSFRLESLVNNDEYCFSRDLSVCKLLIITCS